MNIPRNRLLLFGLGFLLLTLVLFVIFKPSNRSINTNPTSQETVFEPETTTEPPIDLSQVNPEEKNPVSKQARLPYENNEYAITFRLDDAAPLGIIIVVIDKTSGPNIPEKTSLQAIQYFRNHGINPDTLTIEYKKAPNVR